MWPTAGVCLLITLGVFYFFQPPHRDEDWVDEHHGYGTVEDSWDNLAGYRVGMFVATDGKPSNILPLRRKPKPRDPVPP